MDKEFLIPALAIFLLFTLVYSLLCAAVGEMATKRGRSYAGYFWLSFLVLGPLFGAILVACIGDTFELKLQKMKERGLL